MQPRTLGDVVEELEHEGHGPMTRFVSLLGEQPWSKELKFDLSMLRLWIARPTDHEVRIMVTYGDGRGGGLPLDMSLDRYEVSFFHQGSGVPVVETTTMNEALTRIADWLKREPDG